MNKTWEDITESNYPREVDPIVLMSDITSDDLPLVNQYETYLQNQNYAAAAKILTDNPGLDAKIWNAKKFNKLDQSVVAMERTINELLDDYLIARMTCTGEYSADTTYSKTNVVSFNGEGFMCRIDGTKGIAPTQHITTDTWALIAKQGIQGLTGTGLTPRGYYNSTAAYSVNDLVADNNALWQCLIGCTGSEPTSTNTNWQFLMALDLVIASATQPSDVTTCTLWLQTES